MAIEAFKYQLKSSNACDNGSSAYDVGTTFKWPSKFNMGLSFILIA